MRYALIFIWLLLCGHDWYNEADGAFNCCNDRDCRPMLPGEIEWADEGWLIRLFHDMPGSENHQSEYVPMDWRFIYQSRDRRPHVCIIPGRSYIRCLYLPPPGG